MPGPAESADKPQPQTVRAEDNAQANPSRSQGDMREKDSGIRIVPPPKSSISGRPSSRPLLRLPRLEKGGSDTKAKPRMNDPLDNRVRKALDISGDGAL